MTQKKDDRILELPYSLTAEQATLGAALFSSEARDQLLDVLSVDDFYEDRHKTLFKAIFEFKNDNTITSAIDKVTFGNYLRSKGVLEKCGGISYIESLSSSAPIPSNALGYAKIVKENSLRRKTIKEADIVKASALSETNNIENTIDDACSTFNDLQTYGTSTDEFVNVAPIIKQMSEEIQETKDIDVSPGIKTGFQFLDDRIGGLKESQYVIVAARPSCGKTSLALSLISNMLDRKLDYVEKDENGKYVKKSKDINIGFFSLEMPRADILRRMFAMRSFVPFSHIVQNKIGKDEPKKQDVESEEMAKLMSGIENFFDPSKRLYVYDSSAMSLSNIKAAARKLKRQADVDIFFIDYFSRINTDNLGGRMESFEKWNIVSRELKSLAADLKVPIVVLSQLGREAETSKPTLADLRYTGALEQDADIVILLHNPERNENKVVDNNAQAVKYIYSDVDTPRTDVKKVIYIDTIIAKHRNGEIGSTQLCLLCDYVRFVDPERVTTA